MTYTNRLTCVAFLAIALFLPLKSWSQNSVGINTDTPNPNAVLELVSPTGNQGFLIPRLTTAQRLGMQLGETENGLLVFDDEEGIFYFWSSNGWQPLPGVKQPQALTLTGGTLSLSESNEVDLSAIDTDDQALTFTGTSLAIEGGNSVDLAGLVDDADADPENELQQLSLAGSDLTLSQNGGTVSINDADADPGNELQNISTDNSAGNITISDGSTITMNVDDADADPGNEIQNVTAGTGIAVTRTDDDFEVENAAPDQTVVLTDGGAGNVTIGGTYPNLTIDVPSLDDNDASPTNEIQDVTGGLGITVTRTGDDFEVKNAAPDQTVVLTDGGTGNVTIGGIYPNLTIDVPSLDDNDPDPANELQELSFTSNVIALSKDPGATSIDLSNYDDNVTDDVVLTASPDPVGDVSGTFATGLIVEQVGGQAAADVGSATVTVITAGANLDVDKGDDVVVTASPDVAGDIGGSYTSGLNVNTVGGQTAADVGSATGIVIGNPNLADGDNQAISKTQNTVALQDGGSFELAETAPTINGQVLKWDGTNWTSGTDEVNDADFDTENEIQDLSLVSNVLTITKKTSPTSINLAPYQQTISKLGNTVSLTNGGSFKIATPDPVSFGQVLKWDGANWIPGTDEFTDGDSDDTNELQEISLSGTDLSISAKNTISLASLALPAQSTHGGKYLTTNGNVASWNSLGALAFRNDVSSTQIQNSTITGDDLDPLIAGSGITGGGGLALSVSLAADTSGLEFNSSGQLMMPYKIPAGTYGSSSETIQSITLDAKGRVVGLTTRETATGTLTSIVSDERLKKQINPLSNSMEKVLQLGGYTYYMKSDSLSKDLQIGVMAQELEKVYPNLIVHRPDGFKAVNYAGLIPILLEALKEEHQRVSALEAKLLEMESKMAAGDKRMNSLEEKLNLLIQASTAKTSQTEQ